MFFASTFISACLFGSSLAQTPDGFTPAVSTPLQVMFNSTMVKAGVALSKAATASQPAIAVSGIDTTGTFMFVMLDLDVPSNNGSAERRVLLHCMNTGFKANNQRTMGSNISLASAETGPATYIGPSPPPETPPKPHRYVQLLFKQPDSFSVPASMFANTSARIGFDLNAFIQQKGLSAPVAGNFFTVEALQNSVASGTGATASATGSGGVLRNTLQPSINGAAGRMDMSLELAGLLGGLALAAI